MSAAHREEVPEPVGRLLAEVQPERVEWLWPGRVPYGKICLIDGDPGTGKSALTADLAARMSAGLPLPDGTPCEAGGVVFANAEDGLADTIRPRLEAAGADLERVLALATLPTEDGTERLLDLPRDIPIMKRAIQRVEAKLLVLDPLMAFMGGGVDSYRDQDVRRALAPLAMLAQETKAAVVIVRHLTKGFSTNPMFRGGGSIGIVGQARSALLVAKDPADPHRRVLAPLKSNLAATAPSLAFFLTQAGDGTVRVEWQGVSFLDAATLLAGPADYGKHQELLALRDAVTEILEEYGGSWEGEPKQLLNLLSEADLPDLPDRPDELSKRLLRLARIDHAFTVDRDRKRSGEGGKKVARVLRLAIREHPEAEPPNGVHGGNGVHGEDVNTVNANGRVTSEGVHADREHPGGIAESAEEAGTISPDDWYHDFDCRCDRCLRERFP